MKRGFFSSNIFLLLLVLVGFAGAVGFVVYEPDQPEIRSAAQAPADSPVNLSRSDKKNVLKAKAKVKTVAKKTGPEVAATKSPAVARVESQKAQVDAGAAPGAADFGIEGVVYSLASGQPLGDCKVRFVGHEVSTNEQGEFHLWLDGGVGALSFSRDGCGSARINKFDISAGRGLAHFEVYLDDSGRSRAGRVEINGVSGRVYSRASGAPLAHAKIKLGSRYGVTDAAGFFEIWGNDSDLLTMVVSAPGYIGEMISGIEFENQTNPFFYEISLDKESSGNGRRHLALVGIGARLVRSEAGYEIVDLLDDSPAVNEGLQIEDRLVAVDGLAVDDFSLGEVVELIRGQVGQPVTLVVEREGDFMEFTCVRKRVVY